MLFERIKYKNMSSEDYWSSVHVAAPKKGFESRGQSLEFLSSRNNMYPTQEQLLPTSNANFKDVLDYGCGPGNDIVGFLENSRANSLVAVDVLPLAIKIAKSRVIHHKGNVNFINISEKDSSLPFKDKSFDIIHSAGVLHHTPDIDLILSEFSRIIRDDGYGQIMVYNQNSIWLNLYIPYHCQIIRGLYKGLTPLQAFPRTTDGEGCPIANCYTSERFIEICDRNGLACEYVNAAPSILEIESLKDIKKALAHKYFPNECKAFLKEVRFNQLGFPIYKNYVAGLNSVYKIYLNK